MSTRNRVIRSSFASAAFANSASLHPSAAAVPHRVVNFISVVGCGTRPSSGIRQNRRQVIESVTSRHKLSYPSRYRNFRNIIRRYVSIGVDGRPTRGSKNGTNEAKNTASSSRASTRASSSGSRSTSAGNTASHRLTCAARVRNIWPRFPYATRPDFRRSGAHEGAECGGDLRRCGDGVLGSCYYRAAWRVWFSRSRAL